MFIFSGGLQAIAELLLVDHKFHGNTTEQYNITMRRYACMALTNLTFGDGTNKALLCSMTSCMRALVAQLESPNEDLRQVAASVLRNLSWRADLQSKKTLREVGTVPALTQAAMEVNKESTLKSVLSALWNLSAHCSENKADICAVEGALGFLVSTLTYKSPTKTLSIVENGGGILRNISSHIAIREDYRKMLRHHGCLPVLLKHLRSPSLTIVSNACGTLWNLSARCPEDQQALWDMGAVSMLRNLVHSKHKMISMGSAAALKNLLAAKPSLASLEADKFARPNMPSLHVRKLRAMEAEIDHQNLSETCENIESPQDSPKEQRKNRYEHNRTRSLLYGDSNGVHGINQNELDHKRMIRQRYLYQRNGPIESTPKISSSYHGVERASSQDSVSSVHSDISHDRVPPQNVFMKNHKLFQDRHDRNALNQPDMGEQYSNDFDGSFSGSTERPPNSRIVQVMQEVAMHAGLPTHFQGKNKETKSLLNTNGASHSTRDGQKGTLFPRSHAQSLQKPSGYASNTVPAHQQSPKTPNRTFNGSFNSCSLPNKYQYQPDEQDQPINYSMKYPENQNENNESSKQQQSYQYSRPTPQVGNYVGNVKHGPIQNSVNPNVERQTVDKRTQNSVSSSSNIHRPRKFPQFSHGGYAETDLDHEDQPTNYSIRFVEQDEESTNRFDNEQPINYSTRFKQQEENCADCKLEEARRTNDLLEQSANDDVLQTFCTEGTPYLSTATSLTDLSKALHKPESKSDNSYGANDTENCQHKESQKNIDSRYSERSGSVSTDAKTGSTVVANVPCSSMQTTSVGNQPTISNHSSSGPSIHSFNDTSGSTSPSEKPTTYCTEGTPTCFSRASSLSSLHSSDGKDTPGSHTQKQDLILQSIDENSYLDTSQNDVTIRPHDETLKPESANTTSSQGMDSANTSGHGKTVTFDDNNQIQETPLVFSRCSSLGSLSSFDAHSVHSSVVSEYSRRASEVVSPSELPDSPGDTMPPTPTHRKSPPPKFNIDKHKEDEKSYTPEKAHTVDSTPNKPNRNNGSILEDQGTPIIKQAILPDVISPNQDKPISYGVEDTPDFSCATSLSALTIDDEPDIQKDPGLRRLPLGQENEPTEQCKLIEEMDDMFGDEHNKTTQSVDINKPPPVDLKPDNVEDFSFDDVSSPSEGEDDILAECISLAMPTNSKKKMKRSSSDTHLRRRALFGRMDRSHSQEPVTPQSKWNQHSFIQSTPKMSASYCGPMGSSSCDYGDAPDTTTSYATEGTPVHISHAGSLTDLSTAVLDDTEKTLNGSHQNNASSGQEDIKSDVSSVSEDCEDLLSEAIEAAMPKSSKKKQIDRAAEGSERKDRLRYQSANFPNRRMVPLKYEPVNTNLVKPCVNQDSVTTYAEEGTPLEFSRATSFSDLTDPSELVMEESHLKSNEKSNEMPNISQTGAPYIQPASQQDSPRVFGMEGTPMSFSRNDSLSSLSCDEDQEVSPDKFLKMGLLSMKQTPTSRPSIERSVASPSRRTLPRSGTSSPGGLRAKITVNLAKSQHGTSSLSPNKQEAVPARMSESDQPKTYAVEGTPMCFSNHSSLSSLNSDDHEGLANGSPSDVHGDHPNGSFKLVEDTPMCFSQNSSLSSLSVESLSSEPTASEKALLEECINAAMPKAIPKANRPAKMSRIPRTSPTGASDGKMKKKSPKSPENHKLTKSNIKVRSPPTRVDLNRSQASEKDTSFGKAKEQKDHSNQEKCQTGQDPDFLSPRSCQRRLDFDNVAPTAGPSASGVLPLADAILTDTVDNKLVDMEKSASTVDEEKDGTEKENILEEKEREKTDTGKFENLELTESLEKEAANLFFDIDCTTSEISKCIDEESFPDMAVSGSSISWSMGSMTASGDRLLDDPGELDAQNEGPSDVKAAIPTNEEVNQANKNSSAESNEEPASHNASADSALESHDVSVDSVFQSANTTASEEANVTVVQRDEATGGLEITPGEEEALAENANIILSELAIKRDLSSSTLDEDMFIENETISLVSLDYTSDTASEISATLSASSKTLSEHRSEASTASSVKTPNKGMKGARIVKPYNVKDTKHEDDEPTPDKGPKPIRGRRKSGSSIKSNGSGKLSHKPENLLKKGRGTSTPPRVGSPANTSPRLAANKTPPKTVGARVTGRSSSPATPSRVAAVSGIRGSSSNSKLDKSAAKASTSKQIPKSSPSSKNQKGATGITRQASQSKIVDATKGSKINTDKDQAESIERPKPPRKQGTFTKDSPTHSNAPQIGDVKQNSPKSVIPVPSGVKLREKKATEKAQRSSGSSTGSGSSKDRSSGGSGNEAWGKALGGFNFVVDTSAESGFQAPYEQMQFQRNAKNPPLALAAKRELEKQEPVTTEIVITKSEVVMTKGSPKTGKGNPGLKKTGKSPAKQTTARSTIHKSDSNASIKSNGSRSSTPIGRKGSTDSLSGKSPTGANTPPKKTSAATTTKKPAVSKIASLWRRDASPSSASNRSASPAAKPREETSEKGATKSQPKSPKAGRKPLAISKNGSSKVPRKNSSSGSEKNSPREGLSRSSTYDKLPTTTDVDATNNNLKPAENLPVKSTETGAGDAKMKPPPVPPRTSSVWKKTLPKAMESSSSGDESGKIETNRRAPPVPEHRRNSDSGASSSDPKPGPSGIGDIWIKRSHSSLSSSSSSLCDSEIPKPKLTTKPLPPPPTQIPAPSQPVMQLTDADVSKIPAKPEKNSLQLQMQQ